MTIDAWQQCLALYSLMGTENERRMALMLYELSLIPDERVVGVFDRSASHILEGVPR